MQFIIFLLGLFIGSFLNVCIFRIPQGQSIIQPPSHCPNCGTFLSPLDLIPVLSYIFYKGKCRYCGKHISLQYPIIELSNALLYFFLFEKYYFNINFIKYAFFSSLLIVIAMIDSRWYIIPNSCNLLGLIVAGIFLAQQQFCTEVLIDALFGFLIGGGIFFIITLLTNAMGGGDIKLMSVLGFAFGLKKIILIMFLSFVTGALISFYLLITRKKNKKDYIPFGPFIAISTGIVMFLGTEIINWYLIRIIN